MKKTIFIFSVSVLVFCLSSHATASLTNVWVGGDRVVYDNGINECWWYPDLVKTANMTRDEQYEFIDGLNASAYGGITTWGMASWYQTSALKWSLATMATECIMPTEYFALGQPSYWNRTIFSPFLAWEVVSSDYFTPTAHLGGIYLFEGRTDNGAWGPGNSGDGWVACSLMTSKDGATMMFAMNGQFVPDDVRSPLYGAWIVSDYPCMTKVPAPGAIVLCGIGVGLVGWVRRRRTL